MIKEHHITIQEKYQGQLVIDALQLIAAFAMTVFYIVYRNYFFLICVGIYLANVIASILSRCKYNNTASFKTEFDKGRLLIPLLSNSLIYSLVIGYFYFYSHIIPLITLIVLTAFFTNSFFDNLSKSMNRI